MKIYISMDMEGIAGTLSWEQYKTNRAYVSNLMVRQVEWLMEGIRASAVDGQVEQILVADAHGQGDSIPYEITALDRRLHLISGSPRPCYMMPAFDKTYDIVFLVGYHSGAGAMHGIMDHTYTGAFHRIAINDIPMNEALMNSAYAGYYGVPVGLVIGDEALHQELKPSEAMPWVQFVITKAGLSRYAALNRPLEVVREETVAAVKQVLESDLKQLPLYRLESPVKLTIELQNTAMADIISMLPGVERRDGRTIEFVDQDYKVVYNARSALGTLAGNFRG